MAGDAAIEIRALLLWRRGRSREALDLLEQQTFEKGPGEGWWVVHRTLGRFFRAEILREQGRFEEAALWYGTTPRIKMWRDQDLVILAPVFRGRAMALDALGRHEEALHYYRRFVTRWQDADPHLQPQVEEARKRIRELEAELD